MVMRLVLFAMVVGCGGSRVTTMGDPAHPVSTAATADVSAQPESDEDRCKTFRETAFGYSLNGGIEYMGKRTPSGAPTDRWEFTVREGPRTGQFTTVTYRAGVRDGAIEVRRAEKSRDLLLRGSYRDGVRDGMWELYYPDGQRMARGRMRNGVRCGDWEHFARDGTALAVTSSGPCE
jgi:hypothetical protein